MTGRPTSVLSQALYRRFLFTVVGTERDDAPNSGESITVLTGADAHRGRSLAGSGAAGRNAPRRCSSFIGRYLREFAGYAVGGWRCGKHRATHRRHAAAVGAAMGRPL